MCARSVQRPVKDRAKGGYSNQPPPCIPPAAAFHPAICTCGLVCVFHLFITNIQEATLKFKPWVDDWCRVAAAVCSTFKPWQTFTPGNDRRNRRFFFFLLGSLTAATGADAGWCKHQLKTFVMVQGDATPTNHCLRAAGSNNIQKHAEIKKKKQGGEQFCCVLPGTQESSRYGELSL